MKKIIALLLVTSAIFSMFIQGVDSNNGKVGYTNSPGEANCTTSGCHTSFTYNTGTGSITPSSSDMTGWIYTPGTTYNMSITIAKTSVALFGVDVEILDSTGANAGTINVTDAAKTQTASVTVSGKSRKNLTHKLGGGTSSSGAATFNFSWTAPATDIGNVTMYFTGNASDNLNNKTGDYIYGSSQVFTPVVVPSGISEVSQLHGLTINPQPISNTMTISFYSQSVEKMNANIFDLSGKLVYSLESKNAVIGENILSIAKPENLTSGIYFLQMSIGNSNTTTKLIIQ